MGLIAGLVYVDRRKILTLPEIEPPTVQPVARRDPRNYFSLDLIANVILICSYHPQVSQH